jgi:hypothetical protein
MVFAHQWHYDILRALDYFRAVGAPQDQRLAEAVEVVRGTQNGGRWLLEHEWLPTAVDIEPIGGPSRWNTLRALRMLRWNAGRKPVKSEAGEGAGAVGRVPCAI